MLSALPSWWSDVSVWCLIMNIVKLLCKLPLRATLGVLYISITACGGGSSSTETSPNLSPASEVVVQGSVGDGPITGATLHFYDKNNNLIKSERSDSTAKYSARIKVAGNQYPLTIEAIGGTDLVTGLEPDFKLISVLKSPSEKEANINPYSTLIVEVARRMPGELQSENIDSARNIVLEKMNFGLGSELVSDPITTPVTDTNIAAIVKASETFGEMIRRTRDNYRVTDANATGDTIIAAIASDIADGALDGTGHNGTSARVSALVKLTTAQVLVEAVSNNLNVNGSRATAAMDQSIITTRPTTPDNLLTSSVRINQEMLTQAKDALASAQALAPNSQLVTIADALNDIQADSLPEAVESTLPSELSDALTQPISISYSSTDEQLVAVIDATEPEVTPPTSTVNSAPVLRGAPINSIVAGSDYQFQPTASDADGDRLNFSIQNRPAWASFNSNTGRLHGTPGTNHIGTTSNITISVSDGFESTAIGPFSITVNAPTVNNTAPSISGSPTGSVVVGVAYNFQPTASDSDNDSLYFSIANRPAWADFSSNTGRLYGTPTVSHVGTTSDIVISVSDGLASKSLAAFSIRVDAPVPSNTAPSISGNPATNVTAGSAYNFQPTASDADGNSLSFSIQNRPGWANFNTSTGRLYGTPTENQVGTTSNIVISVSDGLASRSLAAFSIRVDAPESSNTAPSISGNPATNVTAGSAYNFQPTASDAEGNSLSFSIQNRPAWASFNTSTGRLHGTPTNTNAGTTNNIILTVSDGDLNTSLPAFSITVDPTTNGSGNFDPNFIPNPADYLYIDLNSSTNGSGLTPDDPANRIPDLIGNRRQVFFNSDSGVQTIPCQDDAIMVNGSNIQVSSYGSGRATISAYEVFNNGWTRVGTSNVWRRSYAGASSGGGPVVGNVIDLSSTQESASGDVLGWQNLEEEGDKVGVFRNNPTVLPVGKYAYDWQNKVMYVNVGANPNNRSLGISCVGRFLNTDGGSSPSKVTIHNLNIIGFARASINIKGGSNNWHIHDNDFYAVGGMYNVPSKWYHGSGIQMTRFANNIEISNNNLVQTFDSPITPQHFGGTSNGHMHDIFIHHNYIDKWALGAVEMADFGSNNRFSRITIEDNTAINGGKGFSSVGDTPTGITDGFQVRGGNTSSFSDLVIRRNKVNAHHANIVIGGSNFTNEVIIENNTLWGANYGINNKRANTAYIYASGNKLCDNNTQIRDTASNSQYSNNTLIAGTCNVD